MLHTRAACTRLSPTENRTHVQQHSQDRARPKGQSNKAKMERTPCTVPEGLHSCMKPSGREDRLFCRRVRSWRGAGHRLSYSSRTDCDLGAPLAFHPCVVPLRAAGQLQISAACSQTLASARPERAQQLTAGLPLPATDSICRVIQQRIDLTICRQMTSYLGHTF